MHFFITFTQNESASLKTWEYVFIAHFPIIGYQDIETF